MDPFDVKLLHPKFICEICDFKCCKRGDWNRHIKTQKHLDSLGPITSDQENIICECGKQFMTKSGLRKHKKNCIQLSPITSQESSVAIIQGIPFTPDAFKSMITPELCIALIQQNKELQTMLVDQSKEIQNILVNQNSILVNQNTKLLDMVNDKIANSNNTNHSHNSHSNNTTINLQFFLNETCKNAINTPEFIEQMQNLLNNLKNGDISEYFNEINME